MPRKKDFNPNQRKNVKSKGVSESKRLTIGDVKILLERCQTPKERMVIMLGFNLALRSIEIAGLKVYDFDFPNLVVSIRIEDSKGNYSSGMVPIISSDFAKEAQDYIYDNNLERDDYVLNWGPERYPYTTRQIRRFAKSVGERTTLKKFHTHMLRHGMAKWLLMNGYSLHFVKDFLRHTSVYTTSHIYGKMSIEDMQKIVSVSKKPQF